MFVAIRKTTGRHPLRTGAARAIPDSVPVMNAEAAASSNMRRLLVRQLVRGPLILRTWQTRCLSALLVLTLVAAPSSSTRAHAATGTVTASITSVVLSGTSAAPQVTVTGTGFSAAPPNPHPKTNPCAVTSGNNGFDYGQQFYLLDKTSVWGAGLATKAGNDCIGLVIVTWTTTQITFDLGTFYSENGYQLASGDTYVMHVEGAHYGGKVSYPMGTSK